MLHFTKGTQGEMLLTLTEKSKLLDPDFLFVFTDCTTSKEVRFTLANAADVSLFLGRYNQFFIDVDEYFEEAYLGTYMYKVYEQVGTVNLDEDGLTLLETGMMYLHPAVTSDYNTYSATPTPYTVYNAG
jgi:hypothetical protein